MQPAAGSKGLASWLAAAESQTHWARIHVRGIAVVAAVGRFAQLQQGIHWLRRWRPDQAVRFSCKGVVRCSKINRLMYVHHTSVYPVLRQICLGKRVFTLHQPMLAFMKLPRHCGVKTGTSLRPKASLPLSSNQLKQTSQLPVQPCIAKSFTCWFKCE